MCGVLANRRIRKRVFFEVMSGERNGRFDPRRLVHAGFDAVVGQASTVERKFCDEFGWRGISTTIPALPDPLERVADIKPAILDTRNGLRAAYFGRLAQHKGVGFLVDNWGTISRSIDKLDVYGTGPQEAELATKIRQAGLSGKIRLHGNYPAGSEYVELIQRHQLVLLPTTGQEGAPLVLLEAMACGVPFVANGVGGIPGYANPDCAITSGGMTEFMPLTVEMCSRIRSGGVDTHRLQKFYLDNFSNAVLTRRWDEFINRLLA
jgi:glycosyltransferase involved in cell wall biosynthesis